MKRRIRKGLAAVLALVCVMGVAGCSDKNDKEITDERGEVKKNVIEVASLYTNAELQEKIDKYNMKNNDFTVEYKSYEEMEEPEKVFANDIIAGKIPDVLDVTNVDVNNYIAKGVLEDLGPFLEKDEEINKDYFVDGVLDVTSVNGKNYFLTKYFSLNGFAGKKTEFGKYADGWTLHDIIECYKSVKGEKRLFPIEYNVTVACEILYSDILSYVDWNTGEVDFDNEYFKTGLEFCKSFPEVDESEGGVDIFPLIREGKLLLNSVYLMDFDEVQRQENLFRDEIVFLGAPSKEKKGMEFSCETGRYAIASTSENKEEAWEFIKYILLSKDYEMQGFPTSGIEFEKYVKRVTTTVEYLEKGGMFVKPRDEVRGSGDFAIKIEPLKEETIDLFRELIRNSTMESGDSEIMFLIEDDINSYFSGRKTLENTIKVIEDKVSKYINENR